MLFLLKVNLLSLVLDFNSLLLKHFSSIPQEPSAYTAYIPFSFSGMAEDYDLTAHPYNSF